MKRPTEMKPLALKSVEVLMGNPDFIYEVEIRGLGFMNALRFAVKDELESVASARRFFLTNTYAWAITTLVTINVICPDTGCWNYKWKCIISAPEKGDLEEKWDEFDSSFHQELEDFKSEYREVLESIKNEGVEYW